MNYAIVDIETTGGHAAASGITEIAIRIHDGSRVIDSFETLLNPGRIIPVSIQALTGINPEMIRDSPTFADQAAKIHQILSGCIFVAHNVNFDYSFVKHHLGLAGFAYNAPKLCTVRLSRKLIPGKASYSLGKLCDGLGIAIENRHRAGGDVDATVILFEKLIAADSQGHIGSMLKKTSKEQLLPPNLDKEQFMALPSCPGVYYFKDHTGKEIYVGKAADIKKRVTQHFTGHNTNAQRQHFLRNIYSVSCEPCGSELMALILEASEIKRLWPQYNRALKRPEFRFALYTYEDGDGFLDTKVYFNKEAKPKVLSGHIARVEIDIDKDGKTDAWMFPFKRLELDSNHDGIPDKFSTNEKQIADAFQQLHNKKKFDIQTFPLDKKSSFVIYPELIKEERWKAILNISF